MHKPSRWFDHFNIEQDITSIHGGLLILRGTGFDPLPGGNLAQPGDNYPWYYEEVSVPNDYYIEYNDPRILTDTSLRWIDAPDLGFINAGAMLEFTDYLVGIYTDHSGVRISDLYPDVENVNFKWAFTQGFWGNSSGDFQNFSMYGPPDPGSDGSIDFVGYFGNDTNKLSPVSSPVSEPSSIINLSASLLVFYGAALYCSLESASEVQSALVKNSAGKRGSDGTGARVKRFWAPSQRHITSKVPRLA